MLFPVCAGRLRKNPSALSFRGAEGDEESRKAFIFGAGFLATLGMTRFRDVFPQPARAIPFGLFHPKQLEGLRSRTRVFPNTSHCDIIGCGSSQGGKKRFGRVRG